jgi:phospholipid/cholesterol/gamma-HCH transport system substrate-binding protein
MENKAHALAAGLFVLALAALLVALAAWLTRDVGVRREYELSTKDGVTGLQPQATVRFRGVAVGKVVGIGFDPQVPGNVLVRIAVDVGAPVTKSTWGSLGFQGVTGLAFMQLDDNGESKEPLVASGDSLPRIPMRPGLMSNLTQRGSAILVQLEETSQRVNQLLQPDNQKALIAALNSLTAAANGLQQVASKVDQQLAGPVPTLVSKATDTFASMKSTSERLSVSAEEVRNSAREFRRTNERMNQPGGTLDQIADSGSMLSATGRSLNGGTLPRLNRTVEDAGRTVRQAGRVVEDLQDHPQSLLFGGSPPPPGPGEPGFTPPGGSR